MADKRIGGILFLKVNGNQYQAKGAFTYNLGIPKKTMVVGSDGPHGYTEVPQIAWIEGAITDSPEISIAELRDLRDATVTLELANGKVISIESAIEASDGEVSSEEGEAQVRFEGLAGREII